MWKNKRYIINNGLLLITGFLSAYLLRGRADEAVIIGGVMGAVYADGHYILLSLPKNKN